MFEPSLSLFHDEHFMDLNIYQYGYEKCKPLHSFGPYVRNHYLFHFILSGKGLLITNDEHGNVVNHYIDAGNGFLIEPGHVITYSADQYAPWEYVWIEFGGLRARECMQMAGISNENPVYIPSSEEGRQEIRNEFFYFAGQREASSLEWMGHLYLLMDKLQKHSTSRKQIQGEKLSEFYVREAMNFIEQNYTRDIKIEDIARRCNLERSYFGKLFKKVLGQSPQEFLIRFRMAKASDMLITTNRSVGEIGEGVGYPNLLHFSRAFKSIYGVSPREYRQKHKLVRNND
ncbi:MAG: AraC family transcriptional regulator [Dorea sp.]